MKQDKLSRFPRIKIYSKYKLQFKPDKNICIFIIHFKTVYCSGCFYSPLATVAKIDFGPNSVFNLIGQLGSKPKAQYRLQRE